MRNLLSLLLFVFSVSLSAQEKNFLDRPYLETFATVDTLITPDRIYINIILQESDSRGKKTTEELEKVMGQELRRLGVNTSKDLTLLDLNSKYKKYFLKSQDILKSKAYRLIVRDAQTANRVFQGFEQIGISNISIDRCEYSREEELLLSLKSLAVLKAQAHADYLTASTKRKPVDILYISDKTTPVYMPDRSNQIILRGVGTIDGEYGSGLPSIEFEKIKYEVRVEVKFALE